MVAVPRAAVQAPNPIYNTENFAYDKEKDIYICPKGNALTTTGKQYKCATHKFKRSATTACKTCQVKAECTKAGYGRIVQRSEYKGLIECNKKRTEKNKDYYRRRQAIVEHPYGTIKRQWGFSYIVTKKYKKRAEADMGLIFTAYNLRRIMNIIGTDILKEYLKVAICLCINILLGLRLKIRQFKQFYIFNNFQNLNQKQFFKIAYI